MRILLFIAITLLTKICFAQDSTAAVYINDLVQKVEGRLATSIVETRDTSLFDKDDSLQKGAMLTVHTEFYTNPQTMLLDKAVEKSLYKKTSTEIIIYFLNNQPVRVTNRQWEGGTIRYDFDIYYMNDNAIYTVKRNNLKGALNGDVFLKWSYQLRQQYFGIVQEYNQTFAKAKIKSRKT